MTGLTTRAVVLRLTAGGAKADLIAFARTVARDHRLGTIDQCVAVIIGGTATLSHVIHHAAAGALSAGLTTLART